MTKSTNAQFHVSLPCVNMDETRNFYTTDLGFDPGRSGYNWLDIDLFGNQITFAQVGQSLQSAVSYSLDDATLPSFHLGVLLNDSTWNKLYMEWSKKEVVKIEPTVFLKDQIGEHKSFFVEDPNGYIIEFKCFSDSGETFG